MSTELVANISQDLVARVGEQFNALFTKIRIYGTIEEPLFVCKDVEKTLELGDLHIRHKPIFEEGVDYIMMMVSTGVGLRKSAVLTELGLYRAMFSSSTQIANEYCRFIVIVMKQLRCQGQVTLEGALKDLKAENLRLVAEKLKLAAEKLKLEGTVKMLDEETDRQHEQIKELEDVRARKAGHIAELEHMVHDTQREAADHENTAAKSGNVEYIALLERAVMKPVHIHVSGVDEDEAQDLPENETYTLRLSTKVKIAKHYEVGTVMMVNPVKQITTIGADHDASLTDLREIVESSNLAYLKSM